MRCLFQSELSCAPGCTGWNDQFSIACMDRSKRLCLQVCCTEVITEKYVNLKPNPTKVVSIKLYYLQSFWPGTVQSHSWVCYMLQCTVPLWLSQQWNYAEMWCSPLEFKLAQKLYPLTSVLNFYHSSRFYTLILWDKLFSYEAQGNLLHFSGSDNTNYAISYAYSWDQDETCESGSKFLACAFLCSFHFSCCVWHKY